MSGLMKWPGSRRHKAPREWVKHATDKELDVLMGLTDLSKQGPLPSDAALLSQEIQARAKARLQQSQTMLVLPSPDRVTNPADESFADWLKFTWRSADEAVRHTLRTVADALRVPVPMSRTRTQPVAAKDSPSTRRTDSDQQPNHDGESVPLESPTEEEELEEPHYHDPPQWHDDHADGWESCSSLPEAFRSDDGGWY